VFDEIHLIGRNFKESSKSDTLVVLEQLLTTVLCPVVCLANVDSFHEWLKDVKNQQSVVARNSTLVGYSDTNAEVKLIKHNERSTALYFHNIEFAENNAVFSNLNGFGHDTMLCG
jgi:hypothetical protein